MEYTRSARHSGEHSESRNDIEEVYVQSDLSFDDWNKFIKEEDEVDAMSEDEAGKPQAFSTHFLVSDSLMEEEKNSIKPRPRRCYLCPDIASQGTHVFRFPTDAKRRAVWAKICNLELKEIKSSLRICEKHFRRHDLISGLTRTSLSRSAIPSILISCDSKKDATSTNSSNIGEKRESSANSVNRIVPPTDLKSRLMPNPNQTLNVNNVAKPNPVIKVEQKETPFNAIPQATTTSRRIICGNSIRNLSSAETAVKKEVLTKQNLENLLSCNNGVKNESLLEDDKDYDFLGDDNSENSDDLDDDDDIFSIENNIETDKSVKTNRALRYVGDISSKDLTSPDKAKRCLEIAKRVIMKKNKQIRFLQKKNIKLARKIDNLESVLIDILEKRL